MTEKKYLAWVDFLRIIACFMVIVAHACDPFVAQFDANRGEFLTGAVIGSLMRSCVPLFAMVTGVLLLPVNMNMGEFYKKRTKRVVLPFIFWSILAPLMYFLYFDLGIQTTNPSINMTNYTFSSTIEKIYTFAFNFNYDTTPLWYIYMLIGLYLFMPIISAWIKQATKKDLKLFLYIWGISLLLPYIQIAAPYLGYKGNYGSMGILGVCEWNPYGLLYYFSGFLGYIVLSYYLVRYPLNWSWGKTLSIAVPLFVLGYAITLGGFLIIQKYYHNNYAFLEIFWYFTGINVFMMTFAAYIIIQKINIKSSPILSKVAGLTFGIFLCHYIFVQMGYDLVYINLPIPVVLKIILIAVIAFVISTLIVYLMSCIKFLRQFVV